VHDFMTHGRGRNKQHSRDAFVMNARNLSSKATLEVARGAGIDIGIFIVIFLVGWVFFAEDLGQNSMFLGYAIPCGGNTVAMFSRSNMALLWPNRAICFLRQALKQSVFQINIGFNLVPYLTHHGRSVVQDKPKAL